MQKFDLILKKKFSKYMSAHVVANRGFLPAAVETKETQYGLMYTFMLTN